jgi:hypothetical protein
LPGNWNLSFLDGVLRPKDFNHSFVGLDVGSTN